MKNKTRRELVAENESLHKAIARWKQEEQYWTEWNKILRSAVQEAKEHFGINLEHGQDEEDIRLMKVMTDAAPLCDDGPGKKHTSGEYSRSCENCERLLFLLRKKQEFCPDRIKTKGTNVRCVLLNGHPGEHNSATGFMWPVI